MKKKQGIRIAVAAAFLAASAVSGLALAVDEVEQNYPIGSAQKLAIGGSGAVTVNGVVGVTVGNAIGDVDFYSFYAWKNNVITVDIDGGMKASGAGRSVDTTLAILGPHPTSPYYKYRESTDLPKGTILDEGSIHLWDPLITEFQVPADGEYVVAVTGHPRTIQTGGIIRDGGSMNSNGSYALIIRGVVPAEQQIQIDIKPGNNQETKINPKSKGVFPVALLSSDTFDALKVDQSSLRFGTTGDENSLAHCQKEGKDVNGDGRLDLVCHFDNERTEFDISVVEGIVKGKGSDGKRFKGHGHLKVYGAEKRKDD